MPQAHFPSDDAPAASSKGLKVSLSNLLSFFCLYHLTVILHETIL